MLATDGIIERRGEDLDGRVETLRMAVDSAPDGAEAAAGHVMASLGGTTADDGALLVVRLPGTLT